uniref:hypothetical protein n=1 Tax=Dialister sp. TaxID=1955814 RepID=UPI0040255D72
MKDSWDKVSQSLQGRNQSFTWLVLFPLLSFGSRFKVQGSGGGFAAFLEEGILDTKPSPRGEGGEQSEPDRVLAV